VPFTLAAGASCTLTVAFTTPSTGAHAATLSIGSTSAAPLFAPGTGTAVPETL
jgi:hypothetical protein